MVYLGWRWLEIIFLEYLVVLLLALNKAPFPGNGEQLGHVEYFVQVILLAKSPMPAPFGFMQRVFSNVVKG